MARGAKTTLELRRATETVDAVGSPATTWEGIRNLKGVLKVAYQGAERIVRNKETVESTHRFFISRPIGISITEKDKLVKVDEQREFNILYITDAMERGFLHVMELEEQV